MSDRTPPRDSRKIHVPAPGGGSAKPPPRPGTPPSARPQSASPKPAAPGSAAPRSTAPRSTPPRSAAAPRATTARRAEALRAQPTASAKPSGKSRKLPRRPKLRRLLLLSSLLMPVLLLLTSLGGWLYAQSIYNKIEKIPLADVLAAETTGTNYLIVGSDTRDPQALVEAGLNPAAFEDGGGQRSDTMLLLRFVDGKAKMMSLPRDLYLPIADTNGSAKINSAYSGGGARRLILTVGQALQIPVHHYMEVDFVSFAGLVDSLGGITIDFPYPAYDDNTGLSITQAGPNRLDGPQALAYVRSRHYVEVIDGRDKPDPTSDLGRVQRQQMFLKAVFGKLGDTRNPFELAGAGKEASGGLKVDDTLGLSDALRLAWRLRSLDPEPIELATRLGSNSAGSVLFLVQPDAEASLAQFR